MAPGNNISRNVVTFTTNGKVMSQTIAPTGGKISECSGTFYVKDGFLITTITETTEPMAHIPVITRGKILHADDSKMTVLYDGLTNVVTLQKGRLCSGI